MPTLAGHLINPGPDPVQDRLAVRPASVISSRRVTSAPVAVHTSLAGSVAMLPRLTAGAAEALLDGLQQVGYTTAGVRALLGHQAS